MNPKVDAFFSSSPKWQNELEKLREILLECPLNEELKWGWPCYTYQNSNIALIHGFKEYCAILFFKGALLQDAEGVLIQQTENVQAGRQIRFNTLKDICTKEAILKAYIYEAIEVEKAGLKVEMKKNTDYAVAEELQQKLEENPDLKTAFEALTPGRQRAYHLHFSEPKQSKTRSARIEKCIDRILKGKGLNDQ